MRGKNGREENGMVKEEENEKRRMRDRRMGGKRRREEGVKERAHALPSTYPTGLTPEAIMVGFISQQMHL